MPAIFLKRLAVFLLPLVLAFASIEYILSLSENVYSIKKKMLEQQADSIEVLIAGTSQSYHSLNPEQFHPFTFNMAEPWQPLYYDITIIRRYLPRLKHLQLVIIPVEYFSLYYNIDINYTQIYYYYRFWHIDNPEIPKTSIRRYSLLAMFTPPTAIDIMRKMIRKKTLHTWFQTGALQSNGFEPLEPPADTMGFENSARATIKRWQTVRMADADFAGNAASLVSLAKDLQEKNIKILFIACPVTQSLYKNYNPHMAAARTNLMTQITGNYGNTKYIDYSSDNRFNLTDFLDANHLNARGAAKFSAIVQQAVNDQLGK